MSYDNALALSLHQRLLIDDPLATSELAEYFLPLVSKYLLQKFATLDEHLITDATISAILDYGEQPQKYDPSRRPLLGYLKMAAEGDLKNELAKQRRRNHKLVSLENVALADLAGNSNVEEEVIAKQAVIARFAQMRKNQDKVNQAVAKDKLDRDLLELMTAKVRKTAEYARVLGIENLPLTEQRRTVKRHQDRLRLRLKRYAQSGKQDETNE